MCLWGEGRREEGRAEGREEGERKNEGRKGERERRDGGRKKHSLLHHNDTTGFYFTVRLVTIEL